MTIQESRYAQPFTRPSASRCQPVRQLIGCHFGFRVKPNTESLGEGTTTSVVTSITAVILIDALFAVLFKKVGI